MNFETSFTKRAGMSSAPVSIEPYVSQKYFELERDKVFSRCWLVIGRVEELPNPTDYIVRDIEICKAQVLVSRDRDGSISCFHNVCSHRANQVVLNRQGSTPAFVCGYHKWTYDLDGSLRGVPDEPVFFGIDKKKCGLKRIACEVWKGFIFINLEDEPSVSLREYLGDFGEFLEGLYLPFTKTPIIYQAILETNWKAVMDGFAESYHVGAIHPNTVGDSFVSKSNPFGRAHDMQFFGPHHRATIAGNPDFKPSASRRVEALANSHLENVVLTTTGNTASGSDAEEIAKMLSHSSVNFSKANGWVNDLNMLFPNFHIDTSSGGFWTHQYWPLSPSRTRWEVRLYAPEAKTARERFMQEHFTARFGELMVEDLGNTERQQVAMESGAKPFMLLGDTEALIRHNLVVLDEWIKADSAAEALADWKTV